ncbi:hypothetical protein AK812_SmicGene33531 [Symbiodinium microadriaticum]|uniref:Uncharacterized protein n=1 Tax=Symbiodinium microadriaticum TaxID=2951 RepID=A0A1Q9CRC8_SYMMI|nr:hypothetical protein AK812_SmicGene33531 [Symbiodinium microadriaticum]
MGHLCRYCHQHVILVRCPPLYRLVQERANGAALVDGHTVASRGGVEQELDTLLRVVADEDNAGKKGLPEHPPPGWLPADRESRCCWVPVELPHVILHNLVGFLYSETTRFGGLSMEHLYRSQTFLPNWCILRFYYYFVTALSQLVMHGLLPALCAGGMRHLGTRLLSEECACRNHESEVEAGGFARLRVNTVDKVRVEAISREESIRMRQSGLRFHEVEHHHFADRSSKNGKLWQDLKQAAKEQASRDFPWERPDPSSPPAVRALKRQVFVLKGSRDVVSNIGRPLNKFED